MHKFGSTGIVTGYIKQLLASVHLPKVPIYTAEHEKFFRLNGFESPYLEESFIEGHPNTISTEDQSDKIKIAPVYLPYLKDGSFQFYVGGYYDENGGFSPGKWQTPEFDINGSTGGLCQLYTRNSQVLNLTKQFQIKNNIYDSYTHEYLGDYLRFIRDFDNVNLMPLYNCFSNNSSCIVKQTFDFGDGRQLNLNTDDPDYRIYSIPVYPFQQYTIAVESNYPVELCCGIYNTKLVTNTWTKDGSVTWPLELVGYELIKNTYKKINNTQFSNPFLYTNLMDVFGKNLLDMVGISHKTHYVTKELSKFHDVQRAKLAQLSLHRNELRLFIKVSKFVKSSIVILEGDYHNWNDCAVVTEANRKIKKQNHAVIANDAIYSENSPALITPLQLLKFNSGSHLPFADRLLEYLLNNCITGQEDEVRENILCAQYIAGLRHTGKCEAQSEALTDPGGLRYDSLNGIWSDALRKIFYNYMSNRPDFGEITDILGYVDKDVEKNFTAVTYKDGKQIKKTMLTIDTWEDIKE
jgi:hypothetical protein